MALIPINMVTNEEVQRAVSITLTKAGALMMKAGIPATLKPEGIIDTNMDMNHVSGRNWDETDALRDILQNAMDEDDDVGVTFQPEDAYWHDGTTIVVDYGRGITEKAFGIGGTKTDACHRGGFGEGLKLALGTLIQYGHRPVVMATKEKVYVADRFPLVANLGPVYLTVNSEWLGIVVARPKYRKQFQYGTMVIIPDSLRELRPDKILPKGRTVFETELPPIMEYSTEELCYAPQGPCRKLYRIIEGEAPSSFYIGGLFMTTTDKTSVFNGNSSYYSYDIWGNPVTGDIEASRRNFYETWRAVYKVYYLWSEFFRLEPEKAVESFAKIITASMENAGRIHIIRQKVGELSMWSEPDSLCPERLELLKELTLRALEKATGLSRNEMVRVKLGASEITNLQNLLWMITDKDVVVWDAEWPEPELQDITGALMEKAKEQIQSINRAKYDDSLLTVALENFVKTVLNNSSIALKLHVGEQAKEEFLGLAKNASLPDGTPAPEILILATQRQGNRVFIREWDELIDILSHETTHIYPASYGGAYTLKDMTQEFVRTLSIVTSKILMNAQWITSCMFLFDMCGKRKYMTPKSPSIYYETASTNLNWSVMLPGTPTRCPVGHAVLKGITNEGDVCLPMLTFENGRAIELSFRSSPEALLLLKRNEVGLLETYSLLAHMKKGNLKLISSPASVVATLKFRKDVPGNVKKEAIAKYGFAPVLIQGRAFEVLHNLGLLENAPLIKPDERVAIVKGPHLSDIAKELKSHILELLKKRKKEYGW